LALTVFGAASAHATEASGLRGHVTRSPITPVCVQGVPCSAPAKNTRLVFFRKARTIRTRTDERGRYRIALAPGWWNVRTATAPRIGSGISPTRVRVLAGRFRIVDFDIDTGIR
jgi:hypothetical protein